MFKTLKFKSISKGIVLSLIITAIAVIIISLISYFSEISDKVISLLLFITSVLSIFAGAFVVSKNCEQNGIAHGLLHGVGYFLVLIVCSFIMNKSVNFSGYHIINLIADICSGILGGIIGINSKN